MPRASVVSDDDSDNDDDDGPLPLRATTTTNMMSDTDCDSTSSIDESQDGGRQHRPPPPMLGALIFDVDGTSIEGEDSSYLECDDYYDQLHDGKELHALRRRLARSERTNDILRMRLADRQDPSSEGSGIYGGNYGGGGGGGGIGENERLRAALDRVALHRADLAEELRAARTGEGGENSAAEDLPVVQHKVAELLDELGRRDQEVERLEEEIEKLRNGGGRDGGYGDRFGSAAAVAAAAAAAAPMHGGEVASGGPSKEAAAEGAGRSQVDALLWDSTKNTEEEQQRRPAQQNGGGGGGNSGGKWGFRSLLAMEGKMKERQRKFQEQKEKERRAEEIEKARAEAAAAASAAAAAQRGLGGERISRLSNHGPKKEATAAAAQKGSSEGFIARLSTPSAATLALVQEQQELDRRAKLKKAQFATAVPGSEASISRASSHGTKRATSMNATPKRTEKIEEIDKEDDNASEEMANEETLASTPSGENTGEGNEKSASSHGAAPTTSSAIDPPHKVSSENYSKPTSGEDGAVRAEVLFDVVEGDTKREGGNDNPSTTASESTAPSKEDPGGKGEVSKEEDERRGLSAPGIPPAETHESTDREASHEEETDGGKADVKESTTPAADGDVDPNVEEELSSAAAVPVESSSRGDRRTPEFPDPPAPSSEVASKQREGGSSADARGGPPLGSSPADPSSTGDAEENGERDRRPSGAAPFSLASILAPVRDASDSDAVVADGTEETAGPTPPPTDARAPALDDEEMARKEEEEEPTPKSAAVGPSGGAEGSNDGSPRAAAPSEANDASDATSIRRRSTPPSPVAKDSRRSSVPFCHANDGPEFREFLDFLYSDSTLPPASTMTPVDDLDFDDDEIPATGAVI